MTIQIMQMLGAALVAALTGGGFVAWINARARRPVTQAEAVARLNDSTLKWAEAMDADLADARKEARETRREAQEAHREMTRVRARAEELANYLGWLVRSIHSPDMTLERLRVLVGDGPSFPGQNGEGRT